MEIILSIQDSLDYICCPDCHGELCVIGANPASGLFCPTCQSAYPIMEGILILLDKDSRNISLEANLVRGLLEHADTSSAREACERTLSQFGMKSDTSYAWEDEEHWTQEYKQQLDAGRKKNWNDRFWQRIPLFQVAIDYLTSKSKAKKRVVIDVGCGEGQDFRRFLAHHLNEEDVYIGIDISHTGLLLNRMQNPHARSIYILGSADRPPLRQHIADVVICLGTLHHMQAKEKGLTIVAGLISKGVILQSDPINGHFLPDRLRLMHGSRSTHDDYIDYTELRRTAERLNLKIVYERKLSGLIYFILFTLFRPLLLNSQKLHGVLHRFDEFIFSRLGPVFSILKPRGLLTALSTEAKIQKTSE